MANITIGGAGSATMKDAIPSAFQFSSWDEYQWFQKGGQGFNISHENFYYSPVHYHHVRDTENKKFFAVPQSMGNKGDPKFREQAPIGCYKYDHQTDTSIFIEFDETSVDGMRNKWAANNTLDNLIYDETTDRLFFLCYSDKTLYEIDQSTGVITQKTSCTLGGLIASSVANNGFIYVLDTSKNFVRYDIVNDTWVARGGLGGYSHTITAGKCRLLSEGSWVIFVPSQQMNSTNYPLMKHNTSNGAWYAAITTNAFPWSNYTIAEAFNGQVYVMYHHTTNNYSYIYKYNLASNVWTTNALNLRSKGLTNGGALGFFKANSKLYWIGSKQINDYNNSRAMQKHDIWEMATNEVFTLNTDKYLPVQVSEWCYGVNHGDEAGLMPMQKSCGRYQFFNAFHQKAKGFRSIPYIDPHEKTTEWVRLPHEANKEKDWYGWALVVKNGKLYAYDPLSFDMWECTIGTWTWTKKDNLYTRIGNKMPYSCHGDAWLYGCGVNFSIGGSLYQIGGGIFTVKEEVNDVFLALPRYGDNESVYVYRFNTTSGQWEVLNANSQMPQAAFGNGNSHATYSRYKNFLIESNENSTWLLLMSHTYNDSNQQRYVQKYYAFNPTDGTFEHITGQDQTSWYGAYGFTTDGKPVWQESNAAAKVFYNDMETMAYDVTNKLLEQFLANQDQYVYFNEYPDATLVVHLDPTHFEKSFALLVDTNNTQGAVRQVWGYAEQVHAEKGGFLLGWRRDSSLSSPDKYGRIIVDNDGVRSVIVNDALPDSVAESATVFTTRVRKNFRVYVESWSANNGLVTFFAPNK